MKQNILFLTLDGLRADKFTGETKTAITPNLDKLLKNECISIKQFHMQMEQSWH